MKSLLMALVVFSAAAPALADVDTVCQGGVNGNSQVIEIKHWDSRVGSKIESARMNGVKTNGTFQGGDENRMVFALDGTGLVFTLIYNQRDATAQLIGQGTDMKMYCSRF